MSKNINQLNAQEISLFCTQIALMLKAGLPLYEGVSGVYEDLKSASMKETISKVDVSLKQGLALGQAMKDSGAFPEYVVSMVEIGDLSGKLEHVLLAMATYYDRERALKERIKGAILYPVVLFLMMAVIIVVLVAKVLPMFDNIFKQLGGEVSQSANAVMNFGLIAGGIAVVLIAIIGIIALVLLIRSRSTSGQMSMGKTLSKSVFTKGLATKIATYRFASGMSLTLSSGVDLEKAIDMSTSVIGNAYIQDKVLLIKTKMHEGMSFSAATMSIGIFPPLFANMVEIGLKTGSMSDVMEKLAVIYEDEVDTSIGNITALIEPILVGILAVIIGVILIAVMLPLAGIMSAIG